MLSAMLRPLSLPVTARCLQIRESTSDSVRPATQEGLDGFVADWWQSLKDQGFFRAAELSRPPVRGEEPLDQQRRNYELLDQLLSGKDHVRIENDPYLPLVVELVVGLAIAQFLRKATRGRKTLRLVIAIPLMIAPVVASMAFRFLFSDGYGLVNGGLALLGLPTPSWFGEPWLARTTILITNLWLAIPFVVLVLLAGITGIPDELEEAARTDGATSHLLPSILRRPGPRSRLDARQSSSEIAASSAPSAKSALIARRRARCRR